MGTYGITLLERELEEKGYNAYREYHNLDKAKEEAKNLREQGYRARVITNTTRAVGYHTYYIYYKKK